MNRIEINPEICGGKPVIKGTRIMVKNILGLIAGGETIKSIVETYPEIVEADVQEALSYAANVIDEEQILDPFPRIF